MSVAVAVPAPTPLGPEAQAWPPREEPLQSLFCWVKCLSEYEPRLLLHSKELSKFLNRKPFNLHKDTPLSIRILR